MSATRVPMAPAYGTRSWDVPRTESTEGTNEEVVTASGILRLDDAYARVSEFGDSQIVIDAELWFAASENYREQCRTWLRANHIDPHNTAVEHVELHLVDAPAIAYTEYVLTADGRKQIDRARDKVITRRVHTLMRVPFPDNLRRPW